MIDTKNYKIFWAFEPWWLFVFPFAKDEETEKWRFMKPKFKFEYLKNKSCKTRWIYNWILSIGWLIVFRKNCR